MVKSVSPLQIHPEKSKADIQSPSISYTVSPNKTLFSGKTAEVLPAWKVKINSVMENWWFIFWMLLLTIYALFGDDIRLAGSSLPSDKVFFGISTVVMSFFALELFLSSLVKPGYFLGFYFWLDFIATVSMLSDIGWIWDLIVGTNTGSDKSIAKSSQLARAARASTAGTRAGRIIRIVRIVRLIRIVKLYKIAQEAKNELKNEVASGLLYRSNVCFRGGQTPVCFHLARKDRPLSEFNADISDSFVFDKNTPVVNENHDSEPISDINTGTIFGQNNSRRTSLNGDMGRRGSASKVAPMVEEEQADASQAQLKVPTESKVGKKLSELTSKRVIILVLGMMFCLPLFTNQLYVDDNSSYLFGLIVVDSFADTSSDFDLAWNNYISQLQGQYNPLVYLEVVGLRKWQAVDPDTLRYDEKLITVLGENTGSRYYSWSVIDLRSSSKLQAGMNMIRTVFICAVLTISSLLFSKDANELVIGPIENMTERIKKIARNPLEAAQDEESDTLAIKMTSKKKKKREEGVMETEILENTIVKIGALLAIGFGEAGSEIIASNIKRGGGDIDPMIPGKKTYCIFGFCDIRNFTDATEVLQEGVMLFVNEIAEIVHNTVYRFSGAANKNIGDAFLLVWKIPDQLIAFLRKANEGVECPWDLSQLADMSLISFLKIMAGINSEPKILKYRHNEGLKQRLANYSVKMGFGLHVGWAIEGAIGSEFKVDASYLSPNVNLASRLEAATKQFGVPILISGQLQILFSAQTKRWLREIDCVMVKGSKVPIRLFTFDVTLTEIPPALKEETFEGADRKTVKVERKRQRDRLRKGAMAREIDIWRFFEEDEQLIAMRRNINSRFLDAFREGFGQYLKGNWKEAKRLLLIAQELHGQETDGPTRTLLEIIDEHKTEAPSDWAGFRELTEK